jgi:DNA primase
MFPVADTHGNIVGFGGRWLGDNQDKTAAKYINTPQTVIYDKSRILFGLDKAKTEIKMQKIAIVVEGYMDCLASHQAGVTNVVASSGTALTIQQVKLLKRYTTNLAFAFDQDTAGEGASKRGIDVAWQEEMDVKVIQLPFGKDPDELIKKDPGAWIKAVEARRSIMDYYFATTLKKVDLKKVEDKKLVARVLLGIIAKLADSIEQTHYLQKLAALLAVDEAVLRDKLKVLKKTDSSPATKEEGLPKSTKDRYTVIAEELIGLALVHPEFLNYISSQLNLEYIPEQKLRDLYKKLITYYTEKQAFDFQEFIKSVLKNEGQLAIYADILALKAEKENEDESIVPDEQSIGASIRELKKRFIQVKLKGIERVLRQAEQSHNDELIERYTLEFSELAGELKNLE